MRETFDEYRTELDDLSFSPGEKDELVREVLGAAAPPRARWAPRAAVAAGVVLALGVGVATAYATGALSAAGELITDVFGAGSAQTETIGRAAQPAGASATAGGVTVTADAVLGDDTHYVIVYSLTPDDPTLFADVPRGEGTVLLDFSNIAIPENEGAIGGGVGAYFYDADPDDPSVQYVQQCWAQTAGGLSGTSAHVKFVDLWALDPETLKPTGEPLATGTWELDVPLDYESSAIELPSGQTVDYEGATVTVTELSVSPLGVVISYDLEGTPDSDFDSPQFNLPVVVNFADGTSFDATLSGGYGDEGHVTKGDTFDRIVDVEDIVSVTVGDVTVEVPHA